METEALIVPSTLDVLPQVIDYVRQSCLAAGLSDKDVFACELATDEACTNIIEHAYGGRGDGLIRVACWVEQDAFVVQFHDRGAAFDPTAIDDPVLTDELSDRPLGGLGVHFMRSLMDEVRFEFDAAEGNTLTMTRQVERPAEILDAAP